MSNQHTYSAGTVTSDGFIPHKFNHVFNIYMPVLLHAHIPGSGPPAPVKVKDCYVYALPGGGRWVDPNPNYRAL